MFDFEEGEEEIYLKTPFLTTISSNSDIPIFDMLGDEYDIVKMNKAYKPSNYLIIGAIQSEMLLVGIDDGNQDRVFMHRFNDRIDSDPSFVKIGENIFEYIHQLEEFEVGYCQEIRHRLYKNWGEGFWRLRKED